jgi:hypothetical protein
MAGSATAVTPEDIHETASACRRALQPIAKPTAPATAISSPEGRSGRLALGEQVAQ